MKIFLAGIMQGSLRDDALHDQGYRRHLAEILQRYLPEAEVYDPLAGHPNSVEYDDDRGREVFFAHCRMCTQTDLLLAFLPEASMGTAVEMWEAFRHGRTVVAITPLVKNWMVRFCSHLQYPSAERLEEALVDGSLIRQLKEIESRDAVMEHLLDQLTVRLRQRLEQLGQPRFRFDQIEHGIFQQRADSFEALTVLPASLRTALAESFTIFQSRVLAHRRADDGTEKLLLELYDGGRIECVLIREADRRTVCISSQVGCAMGCVFCASGLDGWQRNLTEGEILEQMLRLQQLLPPEERIGNIVMMGVGEPLANLDAVLPALDTAASSRGLGVGARRITISTVGLPRAIDRLIEYGRPYHLAVSLHAADDVLRSRLVPANRPVGIEAVLEAGDRYFEACGRRLTYEYVLLAGENDSREDARRLVQRLGPRRVLVNLIPYNPVVGLPYRRPSEESIERFTRVLESAGIQVQQRRRKGESIDAACGQLRRGITNETGDG